MRCWWPRPPGPGDASGLIFSLAFLTGAQASTVQVLDRPQIIIGREEGDVIDRDPRPHAATRCSRSTGWHRVDQRPQSTNGTVVNEARITSPFQLLSQQEITCGNSTFMLLVRNTNEFPLH